MPYIEQKLRADLDPTLGVDMFAKAPGELNYQITELIYEYWNAHKTYQGINDIIGALEGAKMEFYRRVAVPYEDKKIQENGDVYV